MKTIETVIHIDAAPEAVWTALTDLESYAEWNPFVTEASGKVREGARIRVRIEPPDSRGMTFRPKVTVVDPERRFEWLGRLGLPGLFDGRHTFTIDPVDGGVRFGQRETFSGLLVGALLDEASVRAGFESMNRALAEHVEAAGAAEPMARVA